MQPEHTIRIVDMEDRVLSAKNRTAPSSRSKSGRLKGPADLRDMVIANLEENGAEEIIAIPLAGKSAEADHMVIASGRSVRHVSALSEKLTAQLKDVPSVSVRLEGKANADWVLLDVGDVIVHIFRPEVRAFYQLEKMWAPTPDSSSSKAPLPEATGSPSPETVMRRA